MREPGVLAGVPVGGVLCDQQAATIAAAWLTAYATIGHHLDVDGSLVDATIGDKLDPSTATAPWARHRS